MRCETGALPIPPQGTGSADPGRQLDLHASLGGQVDRVEVVQPAQRAGDRVEVGHDVIGRQMGAQGGADVVPTVAGWEGFWPWTSVDDAFLRERGVPIAATVVAGAFGRAGKLVVAAGDREVSEAELARVPAG